MPDGARFERGGEFIEAGYDDFRRRAAEYDLPLVATGVRVRRARGAQPTGARCPRCCSRPSGRWQRSCDALGPAAAGTSAAEVLERTPLEPLARLALLRRLEGTYTVELDRVSASWLASAELRAGDAATRRVRAPGRRQRRAGAARWRRSSASACASAAPSRAAGQVERRRRDRAVGLDERFERAVLAVPLPLALALLPALRERRATRGCVGASPASCTCRSPSRPRPRPCRALEAAFWTWTAAGAETVAASFAGGRGATRALAIRLGPERWRSALGALRPELAPDRRRRAHALGRATRYARRLVRLPPARMVAAGRRGGRRAARPHPPRGRAHRGRVLRHDRGCAAQRRPRRGRGARRTCADRDCALTNVRSAIYTGGWLTGAGRRVRRGRMRSTEQEASSSELWWCRSGATSPSAEAASRTGTPSLALRAVRKPARAPAAGR